ncbi:polysaccharide pyruvyl transferase family protein [Kineococcus arenarius]|uniref:polysaccharide pyruvyl transferase family protein n=1 Tax=unclassified Kineococcus TaxID=2621656 RepID=UPI003D7EA0C8
MTHGSAQQQGSGEERSPAVGGSPVTVPKLRDHLLQELRDVLPEHRAWTAVDFPMHLNCGDSALYLGLEAAARELGARVVRTVDRRSYRPELLRADALPVCQAGGNWGGLYPTLHELRLSFLRDTRGRVAVQMPQSIEYVDERHREELRRAVGEHGRFIFLVRDRRSYDIAVRDYDCEVRLVPDLALALGNRPRRPARTPLVVQARTDRETAGAEGFSKTFDWIAAPATSPSSVALRLARRANAQQRRTASPQVALLARSAMRFLAEVNVRRARDLLSAGEVVVTDRLHGHVLCTLLDIPHVVVDDKFGKIRALYETWTAAERTSRFAASWADVQQELAQIPGQ